MSTEPPSLAAMLEQTGPLPWREAGRLTARIARALDRLHAQGRVHGGIEPLTVLFVGGSVRFADPSPPAVHDAASAASPVACGDPPDRSCDFFALGRLMATMVDPGANAASDLHPESDGAAGLLPPPLLAVQRRLVTTDPATGYGSGNDVAAALELAIAASEGFAGVSPKPPHAHAKEDDTIPLARPEPDHSQAPLALRSEPGAAVPRRRRQRPYAVLGLLILLVVTAVAVFLLMPDRDHELAHDGATAEPAPLPLAQPAVEDERLPRGVDPSSEATAPGQPPLEQVLAGLPDRPLAEPPTRPATRSALKALLADAKSRPCTRLEVEPTTLGLRLVGTTTSAEARKELLATIAGLDEIDKVTLGLDEAGHFCRLYEILARHAQPSLPRLADLFPTRPDYRLAGAEPLILRVLSPEFTSHIAVDYFTADGMVVHLAVPPPDSEPMPPFEEILIGDPTDGQWLTITEPYGQELIAVVASPVPLFAESRPRIEPAEVYLDALEAALAAQPSQPAASTITIETVPARP